MGYPRSHFANDEEYKKYREIQNKKEKERRDPIRSEINKREVERRDPIRSEINKREVERRDPIRSEINKREVERTRKLKFEVMSNYSYDRPHCLHCGIDDIDFLTVDHISGRKVMNHSKVMKGKKLYSYLKRSKYPPGYQILCWNWNQIKGKQDQWRKLSQTTEAKRARKEYYELKNRLFSGLCSNEKPRCACCRYSELDGLGIDHMEVNGRKNANHDHKFQGDKLWRWLEKQKDLSGYQVLCFNCNSAKSDNGFCPHKIQK